LEDHGKVRLSTYVTEMVRQFNNGTLARVHDEGEPSNTFPVTNGVKQGCVLDPTLFSLMFSSMLTADTFQDCDGGIYLRYRTVGKLFNTKRQNQGACGNHSQPSIHG
jgi:hypothetical protein